MGDGRWGLGLVLRRSDGRPVMVATKVVNILGDATTAEAMGVKVALDWICAGRWTDVLVESDSKLVVDGINSHRLPRGYWGLIGNYCKEKMKNLQRVSLRWVSRQGNWAAHAAAKWASSEPNKEWYCNFPTPIFTHIQKDMSLLI
jgi:ribonuclease HI